MPRSLGAVELARRDEHAALRREATGEGPGVAVGRWRPEVERAGGKGDVDADQVEGVGHGDEARLVAGPLRVHVGVVGPGRHRRRLHRPRHHEPGVLPDLGQVAHQLRVAGVEAGPGAGQVRALRQRVHREHAVGAVLEDRAGRAVPRELHVALVAEHRHAVGTTPGGGSAKVAQLARRVAGHVHPQAQGASGVTGVDVVHVGIGHRPAPGQRGAHGVGGVADRRVEDGVEVGPPEPKPLGHARDQLLGADAGGDVGGVDRHAEPTVHPGRRALPVGRGPHRRGVAALGPGARQRVEHDIGRGVAGRADGEVDEPAGQGGAERLQLVEPIVGVGRGDERLRHVTAPRSRRTARATRRRGARAGACPRRRPAR